MQHPRRFLPWHCGVGGGEGSGDRSGEVPRRSRRRFSRAKVPAAARRSSRRSIIDGELGERGDLPASQRQMGHPGFEVAEIKLHLAKVLQPWKGAQKKTIQGLCDYKLVTWNPRVSAIDGLFSSQLRNLIRNAPKSNSGNPDPQTMRHWLAAFAEIKNQRFIDPLS